MILIGCAKTRDNDASDEGPRHESDGVPSCLGAVPMSIQQLAAIAARYFTRMADAMIAACLARHLATGEPLDIPERRESQGRRPAYVGSAYDDEPDWERMVRGNSDTRRMHC